MCVCVCQVCQKAFSTVFFGQKRKFELYNYKNLLLLWQICKVAGTLWSGIRWRRHTAWRRHIGITQCAPSNNVRQGLPPYWNNTMYAWQQGRARPRLFKRSVYRMWWFLLFVWLLNCLLLLNFMLQLKFNTFCLFCLMKTVTFEKCILG